MQSHPSWVRGLKLLFAAIVFAGHPVAPLVGAWIETTRAKHLRSVLMVAPLVGAWIETDCYYVSNDDFVSHPSWVRGLKHSKQRLHNKVIRVAPLVGAWIETLFF